MVLSITAVSFSALASMETEHWCKDPTQSSNSHLHSFIAFSLLAVLFKVGSLFASVTSSIRVGRVAHRKVIKSLLYAGITQFYNRVPSGRVLNRLSKDLREVDEEVGYAIAWFLENSFILLSNIIICVYASTPLVLVPLALILYGCHRLQRYYLQTQRECIRLESITTSTSPTSSWRGLFEDTSATKPLSCLPMPSAVQSKPTRLS